MGAPREVRQADYQALVDAAICPRCKGEPRPGLITCQDCGDYETARSQRPGERERHRPIDLRSQKKRYARLRKAGKCVQCEADSLDRVRCQRCRDAARANLRMALLAASVRPVMEVA